LKVIIIVIQIGDEVAVMVVGQSDAF